MVEVLILLVILAILFSSSNESANGLAYIIIRLILWGVVIGVVGVILIIIFS